MKDRVYGTLEAYRPIDSKRKTPWGRRGANYQNGHDNEVSALKEHYDITLHKTLAKVQVPENEEISISYVVLESNQNDRQWYLWYEVALNAINDYEDLKFKTVI